jgi:hypothetical protein
MEFLIKCYIQIPKLKIIKKKKVYMIIKKYNQQLMKANF